MNFLAQLGQDLKQTFLSPHEVAAAIESLLVLVVILASAWAATKVVSALVHRAIGPDPSPQRRTLTPVILGAAKLVIGFIAGVLALGALNVNVTALLASAGVVGVALGFGAQFLVRDMLAGFSMLSEGTVQVGDIVRVDADTGTVERLTLRILQIRRANGELVTIPNGLVGRIGNLSRDYGVAIVRITVPYRADVSKALDVLRATAAAWAAENPHEAQGTPVVNGVVDAVDTGLVLQISERVRAGRQSAVEADLRQRLLTALAAAEIPVDSRVAVTI